MNRNPLESVMERISRRRALGTAGVTAAGLALANRLGNGGEAAPAPGGVKAVGVGKGGRNGFEFLAKIEQAAMDFEIVGYLTYINLLSPSALFKNGDPIDHKVEHARFTLVSNATGVARSWFDSLFTVTVTGDLRIFYNPPGGSTFNDPGTFSHGKVIASGNLWLQNTINATSMEDGIATGWGSAKILKVSPFKIGGKDYQLFNRGLSFRLAFAGPGVLIEPDVPRSEITVAGNGFVVR